MLLADSCLGISRMCSHLITFAFPGNAAEPAGLQLSRTQPAALHMGCRALQPAHRAAPGRVSGHAGQHKRSCRSRDTHAYGSA